MSDQLVDIRTPLAASKNARVEMGQDGVLHVLAGPVTIHIDRTRYEELSLTLAKALVRLREREADEAAPPVLQMVRAIPGEQ